MIRRPDAIPPSLNAIKKATFKSIIEHTRYQVIVLTTNNSSKSIINGK